MVTYFHFSLLYLCRVIYVHAWWPYWCKVDGSHQQLLFFSEKNWLLIRSSVQMGDWQTYSLAHSRKLEIISTMMVLVQLLSNQPMEVKQPTGPTLRRQLRVLPEPAPTASGRWGPARIRGVWWHPADANWHRCWGWLRDVGEERTYLGQGHNS